MSVPTQQGPKKAHTNTEEPQDPRGTFKSTKHDRYPAILAYMRNGLNTYRHTEIQCKEFDCIAQSARYRSRRGPHTRPALSGPRGGSRLYPWVIG